MLVVFQQLKNYCSFFFFLVAVVCIDDTLAQEDASHLVAQISTASHFRCPLSTCACVKLYHPASGRCHMLTTYTKADCRLRPKTARQVCRASVIFLASPQTCCRGSKLCGFTQQHAGTCC